MHHQISMRRSMKMWLKRSICSSWYRLVFQYLIVFCRYHRWLRYPSWRRHQYVPTMNGWIRWSYMVQRLQWRLVGMDRHRNLTWIFFRNRRIIFLTIENLIQIQYHLRRRWRSWILVIRYSYQLAFWFCLSTDRRFLFRWYNGLLRSYLLHLLFRRSIARDGTIICRFRFWLHQWLLVLNQGRQFLGRVCRHQSQRKRC